MFGTQRVSNCFSAAVFVTIEFCAVFFIAFVFVTDSACAARLLKSVANYVIYTVTRIPRKERMYIYIVCELGLVLRIASTRLSTCCCQNEKGEKSPFQVVVASLFFFCRNRRKSFQLNCQLFEDHWRQGSVVVGEVAIYDN